LKGKWIIFEHHIALEHSNCILHPNATELYSFLEYKDEMEIMPDLMCKSPKEDFPLLHFSNVGSIINCELVSIKETGKVSLNLFALRKKKRIDIDIINGAIIDHCVTEKEWFYLTGNVIELNNLLKKIGILNTGKITMNQYLEILKQEYLTKSGLVVNKVDISMLNKPVDLSEKEPARLKAVLYKYQKVGYLWMKYMINESSGCILGDEMGLGKTLQVITLFLDLILKEKIPILVIAPVSLLENWKRECLKFAPSIKTYIHHGNKRTGRYRELQNKDVVIISYNTAISDLSMLKMINWQMVVLDEAQNIKNPTSERAKSIKKIPRAASIAVTGTPFENHVTDIWSLTDFVVPGILGSLENYNRYISDDISGAEKLEPILSPIMIRRLVIDVATDLPEKVVIPQPISLSEEESLVYEQYRKEAMKKMNTNSPNLALLQKLRMFCTHPNICESVNNNIDPYIVSVKYQRLCEILEEIIARKEKVIVFTSFKKMFDIFFEDIPKRFSIPIWAIKGSTPVGERQAIVDSFNKNIGSCFLALNPRAAGTGLNITSANHVIHYNLEWNPALEDQASARAYRRGQEKNVFVYRLFYSNTVEQVVNERIERKRLIAQKAIIGNDGEDIDRNDILNALNLTPKINR
jgi:SNF2 family DNA or RNA helicase